MGTQIDARSNVGDVARTMPIGEEHYRSVTREGTVTGILAAAGVALWYLFRDGVAGYPLFTPRLLGRQIGELLGIQPMSNGTTAATIGYTIFHVLAFVAMGIVAAAGTIIGCAIMGVSLWRAHPELPEELRVAMSGTGRAESDKTAIERAR